MMNGQGNLVSIYNKKGYGYVYIGQFQDGKKEGNGEWMNHNENEYVGQFKNDNISGNGYYVDSNNNNKYMGQFEDNMYEGQGQIIYSNGSKFKGGFNKGLR